MGAHDRERRVAVEQLCNLMRRHQRHNYRALPQHRSDSVNVYIKDNRAVLLGWLINIVSDYNAASPGEVGPGAFFGAAELLDRIICTGMFGDIGVRTLQLIAAAAMLVHLKLDRATVGRDWRAHELAAASCGAFDRTTLVQMERMLLATTRWCVAAPTDVDFFRETLRLLGAHVEQKRVAAALHHHRTFVAERARECRRFPPSVRGCALACRIAGRLVEPDDLDELFGCTSNTFLQCYDAIGPIK